MAAAKGNKSSNGTSPKKINTPKTFKGRVTNFWSTDKADDVIKELFKKGVDLGFEFGKQTIKTVGKYAGKQIDSRHARKSARGNESQPEDIFPVINSNDSDQVCHNENDNACVKPLTTEEFLTRSTTSDLEWLVPNILPKNQLSCFVACADVGKSILALSIGLPLANGWPCPLLPLSEASSVKVDVIVYVLEPRPGEFQSRIKVPIPNVRWIPFDTLADQTIDGLMENVRNVTSTLTRDTLIIFDPISKFDNYRVTPFYDFMSKIRQELMQKGISLTVLVTQHADEKARLREMTTDDIRGGDKTIQAFDALFALCISRNENQRFLQKLKLKGSSNDKIVTVLDYSAEGGYTHFKYVKKESLYDVLPQKNKSTKVMSDSSQGGEPSHQEVEQKVLDAKRAEEMRLQINPQTGKKYTQSEIAQELNVTEKTLYNWHKDEELQAKVKALMES